MLLMFAASEITLSRQTSFSLYECRIYSKESPQGYMVEKLIDVEICANGLLNCWKQLSQTFRIDFQNKLCVFYLAKQVSLNVIFTFVNKKLYILHRYLAKILKQCKPVYIWR